LSEHARLLFFGVSKDKATLLKVLPPEEFEGLLVSDNAAVYSGYRQGQKCWAHPLRKGIRLVLLDPKEERYRRLLEGMLRVYGRARRLQRDRRYSAAGRERKVGELEDELLEVLASCWVEESPGEGLEHEYYLLVREVARLLMSGELFRFVVTEPVKAPNGQEVVASGTNNEAERTLRSVALARKSGRTNKTENGARCRTVVVSVLESLRQYLSSLTLESLTEEVMRWCRNGRSCFAELAERLGLPAPRHSLLDVLIPGPSP